MAHLNCYTLYWHGWKKSFNDSYDHFGCIQVLIISLGDKLSRSMWNPHAGVLQQQNPFHSIFTCLSPATLTLMVKMNSDIAIIFIKVLSKTWMSKRTTSEPDGYAPMLLLLFLSFFFLFFSVLESVLMHVTTRRSLAREERRENFSLKFPVSRNSALFCLFLPLLCLRRFVFPFLVLFILISVVPFFACFFFGVIFRRLQELSNFFV